MIYDDQTSPAMNYYEELGIGPDATEQEIRKAHRRLVKLMHPDAQPDQSMKMLAETQMRRLNSIVSTLMDPEQRRSYDNQLHAARAAYRHAPAGRPSWRGIPWWLASSVAAVVLTLTAVWLWADHMGSTIGSKSTRTVYLPSPERTPAITARPSASGNASSEPEQSSPVGASYTPPSSRLPLPGGSQVSDSHSTGGISATVVTDQPPAPRIGTIVENSSALKLPEPHKSEKPLPAVVPAEHMPSAAASLPAADVTKKQSPSKASQSATKAAPKSSVQVVPNTDKVALARATIPPVKRPASPSADPASPDLTPVASPRKVFTMPAGSLVARLSPPKASFSLPAPPRVSTAVNRDLNSSALLPSALPMAAPPPKTAAAVATAASSGVATTNPRDPLEGEWVYAPKEPERHRPGFYPPEFIDLKLFGAGDPGNLKGQYNAKYVITDRPVASEVSFELASVARGSRKFLWQSNNGSKGTLNIDSIDDRTIRVDWHTTSAVHGPALTSGTATLVRRQ